MRPLSRFLRYSACCFTLISVIASSSLVSAYEPQSACDQLIEQARSALEARDYSRCRELARRVATCSDSGPQHYQTAAELVYRAGFPSDSLPLFDKSIELAPDRAPFNWQRGIALATVGQWEAGAAQFSLHHKVNPDDVENSAWHYLCVAKSAGVAEADRQLIPSRGDPRPPLMEVLQMLQGKRTPEEVIKSADQVGSESSSARRRARFYAWLYIGLYQDARGHTERAMDALSRAVKVNLQGYMPDVARVYLQQLERRTSSE